jgi:hypothetical protein
LPLPTYPQQRRGLSKTRRIAAIGYLTARKIRKAVAAQGLPMRSAFRQGRVIGPAWPVSNRLDNYPKQLKYLQFGFAIYPQKYPHEK